MLRRLSLATVVVGVLFAVWALAVASPVAYGAVGAGTVATATASTPTPKASCNAFNGQGEIVTCGHHHHRARVTDSSGGGVFYGSDGGGGGIPGWFIGFGVLVAFIGVGITIWRVTVVRRMATDAGMNPNTATAVTLLGNNGVDAAYLAANLRSPRTNRANLVTPPDPTTPDAATPSTTTPSTDASAEGSAEARLRELQRLHDNGLVTAEEYAARRAAILDSL